MKQPLQTTLLGPAISLILTAFVVNADTAKTTTSQITYRYYLHYSHYLGRYHPHRFLPSPAPKALRYHTRMIAEANIDDTPEKEDIVLIVVDTKREAPFGEWLQAFLLITDTETAGVSKKKAFFKLFDTGIHKLNVPAAKAIELHAPPFVFKERLNDAPWKPHGVSFRLVDLTGDGTLDIIVESAYGVALISFQKGEFKEVYSRYTVTRGKLTETSEIEYHYYDAPIEPQGRMYHRFLAAPPPKGLYYDTRMTATANIDATPEKENIVLMTADTGHNGPRGEWVQAFLLIAENEADVLKKRDFFKLFDAGTYAFDVPGKTIEVQSAPFVFREWTHHGPWQFGHVFFRLVDLTGDGILDVWVESAYGVAVISFQNGEFVEVCSAYSSIRREDPIEYIDLDNDGICEIKIPDRIFFDDAPTAAYLPWLSFYEWDGTTYLLNNQRFYTENDEFFIRLLEQYNSWPHSTRNEVYHFYIGLVYSYRGNASMARRYLQWVVKHAEKQDYIQAAESLLEKLPPH